MKIINCDSTRWLDEDRTEIHADICFGKVYSEDLTKGISDELNVKLTYNPVGSGNVLHTHERDQIIFITRGVALIATETEERLAYPGDVVFFPAGEVHSHSAAPGHVMEHLTIM